VLLYGLIIGFATISINSIYVVRCPNSETEKYKKVPEKIQICNFGSSHGLYGFDYNDIEDKRCFNFAMSSQVLSYDLRIMEYYAEHLEEGATVFIPISYFSFFGIPEEQGEQFSSKNRRYYQFLPKEKIKQFNIKEYFLERFFPSLTVNERLFKDLFSQKEIVDRRDVRVDSDSVSEDVKRSYQRHIVEDKLDDKGQRIYNYEEIMALYKMIELCKEYNVEPILVTTPYLSEYQNEVESNDPLFFEDFNGIIEKVIKDTGVRYCDYSRDERFVRNYPLFSDGDHLNREGACLFTKLLIEETIGA